MGTSGSEDPLVERRGPVRVGSPDPPKHHRGRPMLYDLDLDRDLDLDGHPVR